MDFSLKGKRITLIKMGDDPNPIAPGSQGKIMYQDDLKQIHVNWDNGRGLALIPGEDIYEIEKG
jgi:hypothetical protein